MAFVRSLAKERERKQYELNEKSRMKEKEGGAIETESQCWPLDKQAQQIIATGFNTAD